MARKNPTITTSSKNLKPVLAGIDNLSNPIGKSMDVQEEGNVMPKVDMTPNDGGGPKIANPPFPPGGVISIPRSGPTGPMNAGKTGGGF